MQSNIYLPNTQASLPLKANALSQSVGIAYIGSRFLGEIVHDGQQLHNCLIDFHEDLAGFKAHLSSLSIVDVPYALLIELDDEPSIFEEIKALRGNAVTSEMIIILLMEKDNIELHQRALKAKANDIYFRPFNSELIFERINFLIRFKLLKPDEPGRFLAPGMEYKMPVSKRFFDIAVSMLVILVLSPFFILIALIIKLESKGPVIYRSKRAGTGYKIFDFYKFRSMVVDADRKLKVLSQTSNQYASGKEKEAPQAFVKILNDPRITRFGNFLRKTSIDELPQLFNVLKGDMSLVGNRPLPLYEAEQLTSDQFAMRFLGPSGITGLWQISKRGQAEMSEDERKELDNTYAENSSFWMDLKIMIRTLPAMLQKEKV